VGEGRVVPTRKRLEAGQVVENVRVPRVVGKRALENLDAAVQLARFEVRLGLEPGLPRGGAKRFPGTPPTARTTVSASRASAPRRTAGSLTKTNVPAGASTSSPSRVKTACPLATR
jgi:hypothetical protein